jgi:chromosome segregation ATPase
VKLYELTQAYNEVWSLVDNEETDLQVIEDTLSSLEGAIEDKAANIALFVRGIDADVSVIDAEVKRLQDRKRSLVNRMDGLKNYLKGQMEAANMPKIKTATHTISLQNNPPAVNIYDQEQIPASFLTIIPEQYQPDKKRISEALKAGEQVPGAELTQGKSLRIR